MYYRVLNRVLEVGDKLIVSKGFGFMHVGIYIGNGYVVHNDPQGGVQLATFDEFAEGRDVRVETLVPFHLRQVVRQRAMDLIGAPYDATRFNCEHFASYVYTGKAESQQVRGWAVAGILGLVFLAAAS